MLLLFHEQLCDSAFLLFVENYHVLATWSSVALALLTAVFIYNLSKKCLWVLVQPRLFPSSLSAHLPIGMESGNNTVASEAAGPGVVGSQISAWRLDALDVCRMEK